MIRHIVESPLFPTIRWSLTMDDDGTPILKANGETIMCISPGGSMIFFAGAAQLRRVGLTQGFTGK